ncbi:MAG: glycoside hydrolase family 3 C-terminal domain-containing protein [Anaerolineaceae bacterium]|nr:glycoside hydrolase family 3 C-terminal domain-containing protein [Anaerolineaceae bacterium]
MDELVEGVTLNTIDSLIEKMTLAEKASLCTGVSAWTTNPIERLGIPEMIVSDGPHGVRRVPNIHEIGAKSLAATCFPTASCLASTWNSELLREMGAALGDEANALDVDVLLGPGVNMKRSPLGGRNFEYFSEDPFLAGELAASLIDGIQSKGVGTSLKHFAANNQEFQRFSINAVIDERTLREIYLPAFEKAVKKAGPWTVMCAYNKINGRYASEHQQLLTGILKDEWGFKGLVVSDWGAVHDRVASLKAGLDLEMPGPYDRHVQAVVDAVNCGELAEDILNESVRRILRIIFKAHETHKRKPFDVQAHHRLAQAVAAEGMVLLKNDGVLPLTGVQHIAVIGQAAKKAHFQGGGSSHVNPTGVDNPFVEMQNRARMIEFSFSEGYTTGRSFHQDLIDQAVTLARSADVALIFVALPAFKESEGYDRTDLDLTEQQVALIKAVAQAQPKTVVILNNGAPVAMNDWIGDVSAVLEAWMMGQAGGGAIADILFGRVNPSGKLAETIPLRLMDTPAQLNWPGGAGEVRYGEGLFVGYRYYDARQIPVLFPFGYGLSYTSFEYSRFQVSAKRFRDVDGITLRADITNTGKFAGKEIVQVYVHDHDAELVRPEKELKGFTKVELQPGETKTISIPLDFRSFAYYHPKYRQWITETGDFDILLAASAGDIRSVQTVTLESTLELECLLDKQSTIREWMADLRGKAVITPLLQQMEETSRTTFGQDNGTDGMGMQVMDMFMDMPLLSALLFQQAAFRQHPEDMVDDLLSQVHGRASVW